jgi:hypothetical protein
VALGCRLLMSARESYLHHWLVLGFATLSAFAMNLLLSAQHMLFDPGRVDLLGPCIYNHGLICCNGHR